jgi:hypothetical protein
LIIGDIDVNQPINWLPTAKPPTTSLLLALEVVIVWSMILGGFWGRNFGIKDWTCLGKLN